ncbi:MAG: S46 family peptidase [Paucibacter sp.]|nr:S46 family peptidase [Roseateles sp.]
MKKHLIPLSLLAAALPSLAVEGMWMPQQLPQIAKALKAEGLKIAPEQLAKLTEYPMGAVISLGGCTASFVSAEGLVVTNHHCAYGSIQYNSKPERDLLKNGFLAQSFSEELPAAPGSRIFVTESITDVTDKILDKAAQAATGAARLKAMEANEKAILAACETGPYRCRVASLYGASQYQLFKQLEIRDVRLVYAPPMGVGKFGGDTDNWMWPRHTGDFSYYRAYVGPDGKPADFSPNNKPYQPKHHLKLATGKLDEGDFVMVAGYPGMTNRMRLAPEVAFAFESAQPSRIRMSGESIATIEAATAGRKDAQIAMASTLAGLNNVWKNLSGQQKSFEDSPEIMERKNREFAGLKDWVQADAGRRAQFGDAIATVEKLLAERQAVQKREALLAGTSPRLLAAARQMYKLARQHQLPDAERESGYQLRDELRIRQGLQTIDRRYDEATDKALVTHFMLQYLAQSPDTLNKPFLAALGLEPGMNEGAIKARLDALYAGTLLAKSAERTAWLTKSAADFQASDDSFIKAAVALAADDDARELRDKEMAGLIQPAYATTMKAVIAWHASKGEVVYPDANGTLRITFGKITGRNPGADGTNWTAFTTLRGVLAKATGEGEFDAPAAQIAAIKSYQLDRYGMKSLNSVPVNFLSTLDTTGGNSGSPVLNAKGELVGLLFDGTLDSVIDSWDFNPKMSRSICLDARYMQWQMKVVDHADRLLKEMGAE